MNMERAEEVLMHKRLLDIAESPTAATTPAVEVRLVQVILLKLIKSPTQWPPKALFFFFFSRFDFLCLLSPS